MALALNEKERDTIRQCLVAILDGPFIDGGEFHTRLGVDRPTLNAILAAQLSLDYESKDLTVQLVLNNCMNEIVNGLSISPAQWNRWFVVPRQEIQSTFLKWRA